MKGEGRIMRVGEVKVRALMQVLNMEVPEEAERALIEGDRRELIRKLRLIDEQDLERRLREGGPLLKHERPFVADRVKGKKRPRHRPRSVDTALRNDIMAEWYLHFAAHNPEKQKRQIEHRVATMFGISGKIVREAVRSLSPQRRKIPSDPSRSRD